MYAARPPQSCPMTANRSHSSASAKSKASCARATPLPSRKVSIELNRVGPNPRSQGATQRKPALSSAGVIFLQPPTSSGHPCSNRTGGPDSGPPLSKTTSRTPVAMCGMAHYADHPTSTPPPTPRERSPPSSAPERSATPSARTPSRQHPGRWRLPSSGGQWFAGEPSPDP